VTITKECQAENNAEISLRIGQKALVTSKGNLMISEETRLRLASDVSSQSMGADGETVILSLKSGYLYTGNETTDEFMKGLDGSQTLGEIINRLADEYDVQRNRLSEDMMELASKLLEEKLAIEVREGD